MTLDHFFAPGVFEAGHANESIELGESNELLPDGVIAVGQLNFNLSRGSKG